MKRLSLLRNRKLLAGVVGIVVFLALGFGQAALERSAAAQGEGLTWGPMLEVDPLWPCLLNQSPSPRDATLSRMTSSA